MTGNDDLPARRRQEARQWLTVAKEDLRVAWACLGLEDPALTSAAYHCQQAAEKCLKGFLVLSGQPFRKTHDLDELADQASAAFPGDSPLFDAIRTLTPWNTAFRYPTLEDEPEPVPEPPALKAVLAQLQRLADRLGMRLATPDDR